MAAKQFASTTLFSASLAEKNSSRGLLRAFWRTWFFKNYRVSKEKPNAQPQKCYGHEKLHRQGSLFFTRKISNRTECNDNLFLNALLASRDAFLYVNSESHCVGTTELRVAYSATTLPLVPSTQAAPRQMTNSLSVFGSLLLR